MAGNQCRIDQYFENVNEKMRTLFLFIALTLGFSVSVLSQKKVTWEMLKKVTFTEEYDPDYGAMFKYPKFSGDIKALDGEEVVIRGFLVPIDIEAGMFALSANPYTSCFFCGKAGPETVVELELGTDSRYLGMKMDEIMTFRGTFRTNSDDVLKLIYILEGAEVYYGN